MKISTDKLNFCNRTKTNSELLTKKKTSQLDNSIRLADIIPISSVLGAGLMAMYFARGGSLTNVKKYNSIINSTRHLI